MNKPQLEARMKLHGDTGGSLAEYLGISRSTFSLKINGNADFTQREITLIKRKYSLTASEIDCIFFDLEVS